MTSFLNGPIPTSNSVPHNVLNAKMLDLYLREIFTVQEIFISQDKQLANLKTVNKFCLYILAAIEPEKKVSMGSEDESSLTEILCLFDQVILFFGKP